MAELLLIDRVFKPTEKLLVIDSMTGQEAVNFAEKPAEAQRGNMTSPRSHSELFVLTLPPLLPSRGAAKRRVFPEA